MKYHREILKDQTAPVTALLHVVAMDFGSEAFDWEPQILRHELDEKYEMSISDLQSDKIQAGITILTTNMYETDIRTFEVVNSLLNHTHQDFEDFEPLEAEELVSGLTEALTILMEPLEYSDSVRVYAGKVFHDYGFHQAPELMPEALMPEGYPKEGSDSEKNAALNEIFQAKAKAIETYMKKLE
jgi:L-arabinose isomerase